MTKRSQNQRSAAFKALHSAQKAFLIPNPWDIGTAKILERLGFEALATTSLGVAIRDGQKRTHKDQVLLNLREICSSTSLPVNADLENGFSDDPFESAQLILQAFEAGAVGASLEDATGDIKRPIYDFNHAVERVAAGVEAASECDGQMTFTARAENLLLGINDIDDTIRRLQAFEKAGADVLYAPGLRDLQQIELVTSSLDSPVNVVMGFADPSITLSDLSNAGVRRVSIGGALSRVATSAFINAAIEMSKGSFKFVKDIEPLEQLHAYFSRPSIPPGT